jgi:nicotinate-nucleotide adenylyltransferase
MKKIGVLGGSFDPVHNGHISLAVDALHAAGLSQVVMMPVFRQPFKSGAPYSTNEDRLAMLREAITDVSGLAVSDWEINQGDMSYTYLTLRALKTAYPDTKIYFITGTDTFLKIYLWKNAEELLGENNFIIGHRPGYREQELFQRVDELRRIYPAEISVINNTRLDISATQIRKLVKNGEPITNLVPPGVERYIKNHGLYL